MNKLIIHAPPDKWMLAVKAAEYYLEKPRISEMLITFSTAVRFVVASNPEAVTVWEDKDNIVGTPEVPHGD